MKTRLQKWGNSLALRIPKSFALEAQLSENHFVEVTLKQGHLLIKAVPEQPITLDSLLQGITKENLHRAWETGPAVGKEAW